MSDENCFVLEARVWVEDAGGPILVGERFRNPDGHLTMAWHVDPKSVLGVMWIESIDDDDKGSEQHVEGIPSQT